MGALRFRAHIWLRHRRVAVVATALAIGIVGGLALGVVAGARRTSSAPDRLTADAGGDPDLQITQMAGDPLLDTIGRIEGVADARGITFVLSFPRSPRDGSPLTDLNPFAGDDDLMGSRIVEGRFTDPNNPNEFTVNRTLADELHTAFGTRVGDRFEFASFSRDQLRSDLDLAAAQPEAPPFSATLVGVTESPTEFDELASQLVLSKGFVNAHPDVGIIQTLTAVYLDPGADSRAVLAAVRDLPGGEDAYTAPLRVVSDSARRAVRFQTLALGLVGALAAFAAVVITAQLAGRALRLGEDERRTVRALGLTRTDLAFERAVDGAVIGLVAAPVALAVGFAVTAAFPLGSLRAFEPAPGPRVDWLVAAASTVLLVLVAALTGAVIGLRSGLGRNPASAATPVRSSSMPLAVGVHFATVNRRGRRTWAATALGVVGVAGIVGAAVAGFSLTRLVDSPERWGFAFDANFGNPYTDADRDIVTPLLEFPEVVAATGINVGALTIDGADIATVAFQPARGQLLPVVIDGRNPTGDNEIALGREAAHRLEVDIGDTVEVSGITGEERRLSVVGIVVVPGNAGNGAVLPFDSYLRLNPGATQHVVLVDFADGTPDSVVAAASEAVFSPPDAMSTPTTIQALERVTAAPFLLCAVFAVMLLVSGAYILTASVRGRARAYATLRAMGSVRRQVRAIVHCQATVAAALVAVTGVPLGVAIGRRVVHSIVTTLGIVPGASAPLWLWLVAIGVPVLVANLLAVVPARRAAATRLDRLDRA